MEVSSNNEQTTQTIESGQYKEADLKLPEERLSLEDAVDGLARYGGFDIISATVEKSGNLNPRKKARKNIFLTETRNTKDRKALKKRLELWLGLLESDGTLADKVMQSEQKSEEAAKQLRANVSIALAASKDLEQSYRAVDLFLKNTGLDKVKNVAFLNAARENITDLDNPLFAKAVREEFDENFDKMDLRKAYSLLVIPGYLGENSVLNMWGEIAHNHKVTLVTDFRDLDEPQDVIDMFTDADHTASDAFKSNIIMACNWLIGRGGYPELGINEPLRVPPSAALAGKIYESPKTMAQVIAGLENGKLRGVDGVAFETKKRELTEMEALGLVPMNNEFGAVFAMSGKTLFNGDNKGLQSYSIVRVFDWVSKVLIDFLNRKAFENFDGRTKDNLEAQIVKFLESISGNGRLIKSFSIEQLEQDRQNPDHVHVKINLVPFHAVRTYLLSLSGTRGDGFGTDSTD